MAGGKPSVEGGHPKRQSEGMVPQNRGELKTGVAIPNEGASQNRGLSTQNEGGRLNQGVVTPKQGGTLQKIIPKQGVITPKQPLVTQNGGCTLK